MTASFTKIGQIITGAVLLVTVSTGCQRSIEAVSPPANAHPTASTEPIIPPSASSPASPDNVIYEDQEFVLMNESLLPIYFFQASPSNVDEWEDDILGEDILMPGDGGIVTIGDGRESCIYDFRAIFEDGSEQEDYGVDICEITSYTFQ